IGNMALLGSFEKTRQAAARPAEWSIVDNPLRRVLAWMPAFKGITALLDYRPGILLDGKPYQRLGEEPVVNLSDFLRQSSQHPDAAPRADFERRDWPRGLGILAARDLGRRAYGDIRHF